MELAVGLNTSQSSITSWESNRREPDFATIKKIADFFHVPMTALLPSSDDIDESYITVVAETLHQNPKLKALFDRVKNFCDKDLDVLLTVAESINKSIE